MKKILYILLILISMGFTTYSISDHRSGGKKNSSRSYRTQAGYLEVVSPAGYSLTAATY